MKKINFKQPRYALPLIILPFLLFLTYQFNTLLGQNKEDITLDTQEFSLSLGETTDSIMSKNQAYESAYNRGDGRSMLDGLDKEEDSLLNYEDNLNLKQKRYIDSLRTVRSLQQAQVQNRESYYRAEPTSNRDYDKSMEMIRMLNNQASGQGQSATANKPSRYDEKEDDPVATLKKQMLVMDSIEKARDPEYQAALKAEERLRRNKEKMEAFMRSTLRVNKSSLNPSFNSISKEQEDSFIKAVIDENIKGYLGSRIRLRVLENITIGNKALPKGTFLYAQISGFSQQRVNLNVVSILAGGEILPINLSVYDVDGIQGLYIPASQFREMMREMGTNSVQGTQLQNGEEGFFTSLASKVFTSTSRTIANIIRQNKAKLKYNSYIYLINEKDIAK